MSRIQVRTNHPSLPAEVRHNRLYINGVWREATDWIERTSPAHGVLVSRTASSTSALVDEAVAAARQAFDKGTWRRMYAGERAGILHRAAEIIRRRADELALYDVLESGKPIAQARLEIGGAADLWDYSAALCRTMHGDSANNLGPDTMAMIVREAIGVVSIITPWNFPFLIISQKLPYALAAGCTAVIKPSEFTSSSTAILMEILEEAGVPPGVVNLVPGMGNPVGQRMVEHENVDMVTFTGSTAVGKGIQKGAAGTLKKVATELGGKNPALVFADADLEEAADALVLGAVFNAGQCCVGSSRLIVEESVAEEFTARVTDLIQKVVVGDPLDEATQIGPVINEQQHKRISSYVDLGKQHARLRTPSRDAAGGLFIEPLVFDQVKRDSQLARDEIFGPLLSVIAVKDLDEAVEVANDTLYGLSSSVWTGSVEKALRVGQGISAGTVWVNTYLEGPAELPFGGFKESGLGRENGRFAAEEYTELKSIVMRAGPRPGRYVSSK